MWPSVGGIVAGDIPILAFARVDQPDNETDNFAVNHSNGNNDESMCAEKNLVILIRHDLIQGKSNSISCSKKERRGLTAKGAKDTKVRGEALSLSIRQAQGGEPVEPRGACHAAIHQSLSPYSSVKNIGKLS